MRNAEVTRETILARSAALFNTRGYEATSISDITTATGFTKGAIYRHFKSKAALEKHTLSYLSEIMFEKLRTAIKSETSAGGKLRAVFRCFASYATNPPLKGGCPLMNVAIEADDSNAVLRKEALRILGILRESVETILKNGIRYKQIKKEADPQYYATIIIASLEGAIMMSKLSGNNADIRTVTGHLERLLKEIET